MKKLNLILSIFLMIILLSSFASATWIEVRGPDDATFIASTRTSDATRHSGVTSITNEANAEDSDWNTYATVNGGTYTQTYQRAIKYASTYADRKSVV